MTKKIRNIPIASITDLKKKPMDIVELAVKEDSPVYILNRNEPVAVVLENEKYEELIALIEKLEDDILYARTEERLQHMKDNPNSKTIPAEEVMGENWRDGLDEIEDEWE